MDISPKPKTFSYFVISASTIATGTTTTGESLSTLIPPNTGGYITLSFDPVDAKTFDKAVIKHFASSSKVRSTNFIKHGV